jgi:hypothetical protein
MSTIFWNVMSCNPVEVHLCFGGTYRLLPQGRRVSEARNQHKAGVCRRLLLVSCLAYSSTLMVEEIRPFETSMNFYVVFISGEVPGSNLDRITGYVEVTVILATSALCRSHQQASGCASQKPVGIPTCIKPFGAMVSVRSV